MCSETGSGYSPPCITASRSGRNSLGNLSHPMFTLYFRTAMQFVSVLATRSLAGSRSRIALVAGRWNVLMIEMLGNDAVLDEARDHRRPRPHAKLGEDAAQVCADGPRADVKN